MNTDYAPLLDQNVVVSVRLLDGIPCVSLDLLHGLSCAEYEKTLRELARWCRAEAECNGLTL